MRFLILLLIITSIFFSSMAIADERSTTLKLHTYLWKTNWDKKIIKFSELQGGGPQKDGIPALFKPKFETPKTASKWIENLEPVIVVNIENEVKIYPIQVLIWHEIINDTLGDKKIAVTFCPLCNTSIVFNRVLHNKEYSFGTSGLLRNSNLVMYDKQTESLWQQFDGLAIVGDAVDRQLEMIPSSIQSFKTAIMQFPRAKVLSKQTGYKRNYGNNPYIGYDSIDQTPFMLHQRVDERLYPMQRVATVSINDKHKAYSYEKMKKQTVLNDTFNKESLIVFYQKGVRSWANKSKIASSKDVGTVVIFNRKVNGKVLEFYYDKGLYDKQTKSLWNNFGEAVEGKLKGKKLTPVIHGQHFWFSWVVFYHDTQVYK